MATRLDHTGGLEKLVRAMLDGFEREFPSSAEKVVFGGEKTTLAQVHERLRTMVGTFAAVDTARRTLRGALSDLHRSMKGFRSTYLDAVLYVKHHLGKDSPRLLLFGVRPPKARTPLTVEARVIASAKAAATRSARKTMGKRQRQALSRAEPTVQVLDGAGRPLDPTARPAGK
jgi:hypothetical protein